MTPVETKENSPSEEAPAAFRLSTRWVVVGLLAICLGIGCGWIMSSATFLR